MLILGDVKTTECITKVFHFTVITFSITTVIIIPTANNIQNMRCKLTPILTTLR